MWGGHKQDTLTQWLCATVCVVCVCVGGRGGGSSGDSRITSVLLVQVWLLSPAPLAMAVAANRH